MPIFNKEMFNPLFWYLCKYTADHTVRTINIYGSSSSGKTHTICQFLAMDGFWSNYSSAVFRKEQAVVKDTIKKDFKEVIDTVFDHEALSDCYEQFEFEYRSKRDGNLIRLKGVDKSDKLKGLKGFKMVYMDEADQFTVEDDKEMKRRLRGIEGQQIIKSWNPVSEKHQLKKDIDSFEWINEPKELDVVKFRGKDVNVKGWSKLHENSFVKRSGRHVLIKTVYQDNKYIVGGEVEGRKYGYVDNQTLAEFEEMKDKNPSDYRIYGLGEWGIIQSENPFLYAYNDQEHYKDDFYTVETDQDLWLSFDFNKDPCTLVVSQYDARKKTYNIFDIITANHKEKISQIPLDALCLKFLKKYVESGLTESRLLRVTGDITGLSSTATHAAVYGNYSKICKLLGVNFKRQVVLWRKVNLPHTASRDLCNDVLYRLKGHFFIWKGAEQLAEEMKLAYADDNGSLNECKAKEGLHTLDCGRYQIDAWFRFENYSNIIDNFLKKVG